MAAWSCHRRAHFLRRQKTSGSRGTASEQARGRHVERRQAQQSGSGRELQGRLRDESVNDLLLASFSHTRSVPSSLRDDYDHVQAAATLIARAR
jgi:hypothetical protein